MKRGGQVIYAGPLGRQSHKLVEYFEVSVICMKTSYYCSKSWPQVTYKMSGRLFLGFRKSEMVTILLLGC